MDNEPLHISNLESKQTSPRRRFSVKQFSPFEKLVGIALISIAVISGLVLVNRASNSFIVEVPASGGSFTEGVIGSARFINPLLAISNADRSLSVLMYAGLMKPTPMGLRPELAESFSVSEDGRTYRFVLRKGLTFHDGAPLTADDVIFTIEAAQNPALKSPRFANWEGVTVEKINEHELVFTLEEPYSPFLENTTLGILPKHIWEFATIDEFPISEFNFTPVGSGPFKIDRITRTDSGIPEEYILERFNDYALGKPHIKNISLRFYRNETDALMALVSREIDSLGSVSPDAIETLESPDEFSITHSPLPRVFGVFLNKNRAAVFARKEVREALNLVVDKQALVDSVLGGYGSAIDSPIPLEVFPESFGERHVSTTTPQQRRAEAEELLKSHDWVRDADTEVWTRTSKEGTLTLTFSLATANTPELREAAEFIAREWDAFGADVNVNVFEPSDLSQNVIRPRRYDALFFGEVIGRELDLFAFWHSSQRNDPGLNIALYTSITADALLEEARQSSEPSERLEAYAKFEDEVVNETPAIFIYSPDFIYISPRTVKNVSIEAAASPGERFLNVHEWYIETNKVWNIFNT